MPRKKRPPEPEPDPNQPDPTWRATRVPPADAVEQAASFVEMIAGKAVADAMRAAGSQALGSTGTVSAPARKRRGRPSLDWKERFLHNLEMTGNVKASTQDFVSRDTVYALRAKDPKFAADWDARVAISVEVLEAEATRRALGGSDRLLEFLLKHKSEKYRDRVDLRVEAVTRREMQAIAEEYGISVEEVQRLAEEQLLVEGPEGAEL